MTYRVRNLVFFKMPKAVLKKIYFEPLWFAEANLPLSRGVILRPLHAGTAFRITSSPSSICEKLSPIPCMLVQFQSNFTPLCYASAQPLSFVRNLIFSDHLRSQRSSAFVGNSPVLWDQYISLNEHLPLCCPRIRYFGVTWISAF